MAKTARDMSIEEWRAYHPGIVQKAQRGDQTPPYYTTAWKVAHEAARLLRARFGAQKVAVFGLLLDPQRFTPDSDIDLAAWGIPAAQFYDAMATVSTLSTIHSIDLVDPETCRPGILHAIRTDGIEL